MICNKCTNEAVKNHANNKEFYYCRACKIEVVEKTEEVELFELAKEWDYYAYPSQITGSPASSAPCVCHDINSICLLHTQYNTFPYKP